MRVYRQHKPTSDVRGEAALKKVPQKFNGLDPTESDEQVFEFAKLVPHLVGVR
jgi:hypothetical protein